MAEINLTLRLTFRHRWLGLAFVALVAIPSDLLGLTYSDRATDRFAHIAYRLMGPKITAT